MFPFNIICKISFTSPSVLPFLLVCIRTFNLLSGYCLDFEWSAHGSTWLCWVSWLCSSSVSPAMLYLPISKHFILLWWILRHHGFLHPFPKMHFKVIIQLLSLMKNPSYCGPTPPMPLWYLFPGQLAANDGFYLIEDANRGVNPAWSNCCLSEQSTVSKTVLWLSSSLFLEVTELFRVPFGIKELVWFITCT